VEKASVAVLLVVLEEEESVANPCVFLGTVAIVDESQCSAR
jgi:hypothetical protein